MGMVMGIPAGENLGVGMGMIFMGEGEAVAGSDGVQREYGLIFSCLYLGLGI